MVVIDEVDSDDERKAREERPWETIGTDRAWQAKKEPLSEEEEKKRQEEFDAYEAEERARVEKQFQKGEACRKAGNDHLGNADYAGAIDKYEEGMQELTMVGNTPEARARAEKANLALHLNVALAKLKLGEYLNAKHQCDMALVIDATNAKALYRRGLAQASLARESALFQDEDAKAAIADFEAILKRDPSNADAYRELQELKNECRKHAQDLVAKQRETWTRVFGGKTVVEGEEEKEEAPPPTIRPCWDYSRHSWLSIKGVSIKGNKGSSLEPFDMELREAWCVGLWTPGENIASGAALARVAAKKQSPNAGQVIVNRRPEWVYINPLIVISAAVAALAMPLLFYTFEFNSIVVGASGVICGIMILPLVAMWASTRSKTRVDMVLITSDAAGKELAGRSTVESVIGDHLHHKIEPTERRERVVAMLRASGCFEKPEQDIRDGICIRDLSDAQQQVVYILKCLAMKPHVLICAEPLQALDKNCQLRMLRMIKRLKQDLKTSVFYISADPGHLRLISDSFGILVDGKMPELGPTEEVLGAKPGPRAAEMREALESARPPAPSAWEEAPAVGADWLERAQAIADDKALDAAWLPNSTGSIPKY